jgi:hypothetical protein
MKLGTAVNVSQLSGLFVSYNGSPVRQRIYVLRKVKGGWKYMTIEDIGYHMVPKGAAKKMCTADGYFAPTKKGSYSFKYVLNDGSKKAFTLTIKVK